MIIELTLIVNWIAKLRQTIEHMYIFVTLLHEDLLNSCNKYIKVYSQNNPLTYTLAMYE